jgi:hypothetical protein
VTGGRAHVTLSALPPDEDVIVAGTVADLCLPRGPTELVHGAAGVLHVVGPPGPAAGPAGGLRARGPGDG